PGINPRNRASIGLIGAVGRGIGRTVRKPLQPTRDPHHPGTEREFAPELVKFLQVEPQRGAPVHPRGFSEDLSRDKWISVAIAANPAAHPQKCADLRVLRRRIYCCELIFQREMETRDLPQKGVLIVAEPVGHFVDYGEPGASQQTGLPQGQDSATELVGDLAVLCLGQIAAIALFEQIGNSHLARDRTLAPYFSWMRR